MKIFQNIKINYYQKQLDDLIKNANFQEVKYLLSDIQKRDPKLFYQILKLQFNNITSIRSTENIFENNIIFINSFIKNNQKLISSFLNFYFQEISDKNYLFQNFNSLFVKTGQDLLKIDNINFQTIIDHSIIFQILWSMNEKYMATILENDFAFFSTSNNYNFCDSLTTNSFILIVDHPYQVYSYFKNNFNQNKELAQNFMFNLDNRLETFAEGHCSMEVVKKDFVTHTLSWVDPNVINSMKGQVIKVEEMLNNPLESFANVILHLINCGFKTTLKYNVIEQYIKSNPINNLDRSTNLSNHEKKFIQKQCQPLGEELGFDF